MKDYLLATGKMFSFYKKINCLFFVTKINYAKFLFIYNLAHKIRLFMYIFLAYFSLLSSFFTDIAILQNGRVPLMCQLYDVKSALSAIIK